MGGCKSIKSKYLLRYMAKVKKTQARDGQQVNDQADEISQGRLKTLKPQIIHSVINAQLVWLTKE